jgi:hypothetical protein
LPGDAIQAAVFDLNRSVRQKRAKAYFYPLKGKSQVEQGRDSSTAQFPRLIILRQDHFENPFVMFVQ